jgi:hypothetical protein
LLRGVHLDDLDGEIDQIKGYRSLLSGQPPDIEHFSTVEEEGKFVVGRIKSLLEQEAPEDICIVKRSKKLLADRYQPLLKKSSIDSVIFDKKNSRPKECLPGHDAPCQRSGVRPTKTSRPVIESGLNNVWSRHFSDIRGLHCICDKNEGHKSHSFRCGKLLMSDTHASPRNSKMQLQEIAAIFACAVRRHRQDRLNKADSGEEGPTGVDLSAETRLSVSHGEDDRELP